MNALLLLFCLVASAIVTARCVTCPPDKPYSVSNLCFKSCESIPFGKYTAQPQSFLCFRVPSNDFRNSSQFDLDERLLSCKGENVAMFWSWVAYEYNPERFTGLVFSEHLGYKRLRGCGEWQIVNEIHDEDDYLNSHATFAVNEQRGVVVLAFKGTEMSKRWKEDFVDWILNDLFVSLEPCEISESCSNSRLHAGFQRSVLSIKSQILGNLKPYLEAGYIVVITGHSKGGAMATVSTVLALNEFRNISNSNELIYSISFGSPRVGDISFVDYYNNIISIDRTARYVDTYFQTNQDDIVTTLPPTWLGYDHVKNPKYIHCDRKWFGNPDPIPGIHFQW